jgi:phospholipid transport system substrate-binding protein
LAQSPAERAEHFVKQAGDRLVGVVNSTAPQKQKRQELTQIIDQIVDVDEVARFALGRFWRQASPEQQKRYLELFHQVLVSNISAKLGEYRGVYFTVGRVEPFGENESVSTIVYRPNNPPTNVNWIISNPSTQPKIIDVVAEGTSLRMTQRSDYSSYLVHNNGSIDALISAMRQQIEQNLASS